MSDSPSGKGADRKGAIQQGINDLPADLLVHATPKEVPEIVFADQNGNPLRLDDFSGNMVILNLWATWCAPCREEMPSLNALQTHFSDAPVTVLALSLDRGKSETPKAFLKSLNVEGLVFAHDPKSRSARALGAFGLPTTVLIDPQGREVARLLGEAEWDTPAMKDFISSYLP